MSDQEQVGSSVPSGQRSSAPDDGGMFKVPGDRLRELRAAEAERDRYRAELLRIQSLFHGANLARKIQAVLDGE